MLATLPPKDSQQTVQFDASLLSRAAAKLILAATFVTGLALFPFTFPIDA
jgi:hypothetical protein